MTRPTRLPLRPLAALLAAALALAGCGARTTAPTGNGDVGGIRLVAFASDRGQSAGLTSIYLWDADSLFFRDLSNLNVSLEPRHHPSLSTDGRFIAFSVSRNGQDDVEVYDRKYRRTDANAASAINTGDNENEPTFTGDGHMLCFTQGTAVRRVRLFDGPNSRFVPLPGLDTTAAYSDWAPAPNYDGSLIAFVSDRRGNPDIFLYDRRRGLVLDGPNVRSALQSGGADVDPRFSPSGRFLAFASNRGTSLGGYDVYLLEFYVQPSTTDTLLRDVSAANSAADERHPAINDAGNLIVFQSNRSGQGRWDLWDLDRTTNTVSQPGVERGYSTVADELEPSLKWSY